MGELYREVGKLDQAVTPWRRVIELAPRQRDGYLGLGETYLDQQQPIEAKLFAQQALEVDPEFEAAQQLLNRANAQLAQTKNSK